MNFRLIRVLKEAESKVYSGVNLIKGAIALIWVLLCLFIISSIRNVTYAAVSGGLFYLSLIILCLLLFKDVGSYIRFPKENKKLPLFMGHKADIILVYPLLLMALIGIISSGLAATVLIPAVPQQAGMAGVRIMLLPLVAFAEELFNLIMVSFFYKHMKLFRSFRLIASILSAAMFFGIMHSFGWGIKASILTGTAYIPVFFVTLYTGNIWISFLAHFYNDLIAFVKLSYGSWHLAITAAVCFIPAAWAVKTLFRKPQ